MKLRLSLYNIIFATALTVLPVSGDDFYRTIDSATVGWTDEGAWSANPSGTPSDITWDNVLTGGIANLTVVYEGEAAINVDDTISLDGIVLSEGSLNITGSALQLNASGASITLKDGTSLVIATLPANLSSSTTVNIGDNSMLTLGSASSRVAQSGTLEINLENAGNASFMAYLVAGGNAYGSTLKLGENANLKNLYIDGTLRYTGSQIGSADIHLTNGSRIVVTDNDSITDNDVYLDGSGATMTVWNNKTATVNSTIQFNTGSGGNFSISDNGTFTLSSSGSILLGTGSFTAATRNTNINGTLQSNNLILNKGTYGTSFTVGSTGTVDLAGTYTGNNVTSTINGSLTAAAMNITSGTHTVNGNVAVSGMLNMTGGVFNQSGGTTTLDNLQSFFSATSSSTASINLSGGTLVITGTNNSSSSSTNSIMFGRYGGGNTTNFTVTGGKLDASGAIMVLSRSGNSVTTVTGGEVDILGIRFNNYSSSPTGIFYLGSAEDGSGSGTLKIGAGGIYLRSNDSLYLGQGTIVATSSWETANAIDSNVNAGMSGSTTSAGSIIFTHADRGTVFDTNGNTVTIKHATTGVGKVVLNDSSGTGRLVLNNTIGHTGGTLVEQGTLVANSLISDVTVDSNGVLLASQLGNNIILNGGKLQSNSSAMTFSEGFGFSSGQVWVNKNGASAVEAGTMTVSGDFAMSGGSLYIAFINGTTYDQIVCSELNRDVATATLSGGVLNLLGIGETFDYDETYQIFTGFDSVLTDSAFTIVGYDQTNWTANIDSNGVLFFTNIPEPSSLAMLGLASFGLFQRRRKNR